MCLRRFKTRAFSIEAIDRLLPDLRDGSTRYLSGSHLSALFDEDRTHFARFWKNPISAIKAPEDRPVALHPEHPIQSQEQWEAWRWSLVKELFQPLGSLDIVSVVLRCVHPRDFGVYSPIHLNFLHIGHTADPVRHYLRFCDELRKWGIHFLAKDTNGLIAAWLTSLQGELG